MKYYRLTPIGANRKEIGISPQSTEGFVGDIQQDFIPFEGKIDFDFRLPIPILEDKAKPTTMLSVVMVPEKFLVVRNSFIDFLKKFKIGEYQQWPIEVHHMKNVLEDYRLLFLNETKQTKYIDFDKSEFYIGSLTDYTFIGEEIKVSDYENYQSTREILRENNLWLKCKKTIFNLSKACEDMFRIVNVPNGGYFVSERLKNAIEKEKFTGMVFKEITDTKKVDVIY